MGVRAGRVCRCARMSVSGTCAGVSWALQVNTWDRCAFPRYPPPGTAYKLGGRGVPFLQGAAETGDCLEWLLSTLLLVRRTLAPPGHTGWLGSSTHQGWR